ncbi:unnamed protein product [Rotaria socialis]|uniref:ATP-dependent DNA helicase n=1 Tax=Rotaria socialis TaxID=392032 RepID=A0A818BNT3_9BILA|nr:unnamed protein product [Rotaria socialis]
MALDHISTRTYSSEPNSVLNKLLNHIKTIGGRVMGSAYSRAALRIRIHALIFNQGLPSIFLTLDLADIHSPVALYFAGVNLDLDNIRIEQLMTTYKRAETIACHPIATAKFFHLLITNILDTMIVGGVLGPVKAYFGTVENQGRGSLHLHLFIWLDHDMKQVDMKENIRNTDFREKLKAYLEDIVKEDLDQFKDEYVFENFDGIPANQGVDGEYDIDDSEQLLELLGNLDEYTATAANANKKSTENKYIEETIEAAENVGRFSHMNSYQQSSFNEFINLTDRQLVPFVSATPDLVRLNTKWQEQLKPERERVRRSSTTGNCDRMDDTLDLNAAKDAVITVVNSNTYNKNIFENCGSILPVVSITTNFPTQKSIADEFTLNREQRAAFMIITSHLDGDSRCRTGDNSGQLRMCIPGCGGTGKSQLIRALTKYSLVTKRTQMVRKLAPTGIAAAEIGGMTIHSFLGEQRNSGKARTIKAGDLKLEKEWRLIEYLLIDEMSMVGLTLLVKLNRIISAAKHVDPQIPFGAPILVFRNEVRTQLNCEAAIHNATQSGYAPIVCVAQDTCKGKPIEDPILIKKLLELSDNKTEHLPGLLPFVPGLPVILTQNIAIKLGLINGINGIFRQLVHQPDFMSTDVLLQAFPNNTQYVH